MVKASMIFLSYGFDNNFKIAAKKICIMANVSLSEFLYIGKYRYNII